MKRLLVLLVLLFSVSAARADACTASINTLSFGNVSPITASDVFATASGSVTCNWTLLASTPPFLLLFPKAVVCVNIGIGSNSTVTTPRTLGNASARMDYNLYLDSSYSAAAIWGAPSVPSTPTPLTLVLAATNLVTGGSIVQPFTVYGKIPAGANLAAVPTVSNANTVYSSSFAGVANITYAFFNLIQPACTAGFSSSVSFQVQATAINDCTVSATSVNFGPRNVLVSAARATGALTVRCVNNDAYQIALSGGTVAGNVAARRMKPLAGGAERISYQLSASLDGPVWGDGTAGTTVYSGTGTGSAVDITVYGMLPAQTTPTPGDYSDTVTATVYF
jgi:spore coat protein U-like protein